MKSFVFGAALPYGSEAKITRQLRFTVIYDGERVQVESSGGVPEQHRIVLQGVKGKWVDNAEDLEKEAQRAIQASRMQLSLFDGQDLADQSK